MPESILKTLLEALEVYDGDPEEILVARIWLHTQYSVGRVNPEEAAYIRAELARREAEDDEADDRDHEDVMREMYEIINNFQPEKEQVKV